MKKIAVVTGTRADYGLLLPLIKRLKKSEDFQLQLIVCCMHWLKEFGYTFKQIEADGFVIDERIDMLMGNDTPDAIAKSMGLGMIAFSDAIMRLKPDLLVVLGDRFEIAAAAQAAFVARVPIAHIHGGETTFGALDESFRHAVSKFSHLHFVAADEYRQRVIQMGESPDRVLNVGAIGLDNLNDLELLSKEQWQQQVGFKLGKLNFLVTYHPATIAPEKTIQVVNNLLKALDQFPQANILFTKSNADESGRSIGAVFEQYAKKDPARIKAVENLGTVNYLSALQHFDLVIGNSSSGLIEVPYFNKPSINIGNRQAGRLRASSVIDCGEQTEDVTEAISQALSADFQKLLEKVISPYGQGSAAEKIIEFIKQVDFDDLIYKRFHDLELS